MHKDPFFSSLTSALEALRGPGTGILSEKRVFGGDINDARRLALTDGTVLFMKSNALSGEAMFRAEFAGLTAL
ncbi:MAG: fructosamine kinase family protein, partial [Lachnospiraceae bacterium]|nr:fructosamine kinase family protein [Lachnospiraceae bacterium]